MPTKAAWSRIYTREVGRKERMRSKVARTGFLTITTARELSTMITAERAKAISTRGETGTIFLTLCPAKNLRKALKFRLEGRNNHRGYKGEEGPRAPWGRAPGGGNAPRNRVLSIGASGRRGRIRAAGSITRRA